MSAMASTDRTLEMLAAGMRILHHAGLDSGAAGHVSMRVPGQDVYWINPWGVLWDEIRAEDLIQVTFDLEPVGTDRSPSAGSGFHAAIYRRRPDVQVVCHTHAPYIIALATTRQVLGMFDQRAPIFLGRMATFEQRTMRREPGVGYFGTDENESMATALGDGVALFLDHHGAINVGPDIGTTIMEHIYLEECARTQLWATTLGGTPMREELARDLQEATLQDGMRIPVEWEGLLRRLRRTDPDLFVHARTTASAARPRTAAERDIGCS
jgi:ribulose-5-phosphate 4-epimerase/fuculose-1-phosphate aldolase